MGRKVFEEELFIRCSCHGNHYIEMSYDKDFGLGVSIILSPDRFWRDRLKAMWEIFRGKHSVYDEIILDDLDVKQLQKFFEDVIESDNKKNVIKIQK